MATSPRGAHTDDQDIFDFNIDELVKSLLAPVDAVRSQTPGDGFLESRLNAFYRMMGFPIVKNNLEFFSPGYDVNLNTDQDGLFEHKLITAHVANNKQVVSQQLNPREQVFKDYNKIFAAGGFNSRTLALGSLHIRSFEGQFGSTGPLEFDSKQVQLVSQRITELTKYYAVSSDKTLMLSVLKSGNHLASKHPLKPFVVDPRIEILPDTNLIAAPFLINSAQLACFNGTSYKRPYIERVISLRLNNQNNVKSNVNINKIISDIKADNNVTSAVLLNTASNPEKNLQNSDVVVFNNLFKIIKALVKELIKNIKEAADVSRTINFQPIPHPVKGIEGEMSILGVEQKDNNNQEIEKNIIELYNKTSLDTSAFTLDFGPQGKVDEGNFVFSNIDDVVFSADKVAQKSTKEQLDELISLRTRACNSGIESIRNIEYIMGEFSGLGLIDIIAIQAAFWLMDRDKLVGLIDARAYARLKEHRPNLNVKGISRSEDIFESLKDFETKLKDIYLLIQLYFNQLYSGKAYISS